MRTDRIFDKATSHFRKWGLCLCVGILSTGMVFAQNTAARTDGQDTTVDTVATAPAPKPKKEKDLTPVRSPFEGEMLIDDHTIVMPSANSLTFLIQHRFGNLNNGITDLYGLYAPANIRLAINYTILDNLQVGIGTTKNGKLQDGNIKWNIFSQARSGGMPFALTYYVNAVINAGPTENFPKKTNRLSYFHQLIIGRKFNRFLSLQVAGSVSHYNLVDTLMNHDNYGISVSGRVKVTPQGSIIFEYDQLLNEPKTEDKPFANVGLGYEISTGGHVFQIYVGSANGILNQQNFVYNQNDFTKKQLGLGFNISRVWNF